MKLGVNIDHIATIRNARLAPGVRSWSPVFPDPVEAAQVCERAGASSIVMHLREDRRHIRDADLARVKKAVGIRLNMEMSASPEIVRIAERLVPHQATLVPEKRREMTTEGGLDLLRNVSRVGRAVRCLKDRRIEVSLFIDPVPRQIEAARRMGADAVEFHTGDYARVFGGPKGDSELKKLKNAVVLARSQGLLAHAGHGLDYENILPIKKFNGLDELNIGYAIISRALWVGLDSAVRQMIRSMR